MELLILLGLPGHFVDLLILREMGEIADLRFEISEWRVPTVAEVMADWRKARGMGLVDFMRAPMPSLARMVNYRATWRDGRESWWRVHLG